jgi:hypothetical protein
MRCRRDAQPPVPDRVEGDAGKNGDAKPGFDVSLHHVVVDDADDDVRLEAALGELLPHDPITLPTGKEAKIPGIPLEMDGRKPHVRYQPPKMGEHTIAILEEAGYSRGEIEALVRQPSVVTEAATTSPAQ